MFFDHISEPMKFMVQELRAGRAPANVMNAKKYPPQGTREQSVLILGPLQGI